LLRRRLSYPAIGGVLLAASLVPALLRTVLQARAGDDPGLWIRVYFAPDTRADALMLGCALAAVLAAQPPRPRLAWALGAVAGAAALAYLAATHDIPDLVRRPWLFTVTACASAAVLRAVWSGGAWARVLELPPLPWLGRLSYSLYLWHLVGLYLSIATGVVARVAILLALPSASYYLVERPFLALKDRLSATKSLAPRPRAVRLWLQPVLGLAALALMVSVGYHRLLTQPASVRLMQARDRLAQRPRDPQRLAEMGEALVQAGDPDAAVSAFQAAVAIQPGNAAVVTGLGLALRRAGRATDARAGLADALRLDPRQARASFGLGELALDGDRLDEAVGDYERSLAIQPDFEPAHTGAGVSYALKGELDAAIRHFAEAVRL